MTQQGGSLERDIKELLHAKVANVGLTDMLKTLCTVQSRTFVIMGTDILDKKLTTVCM